MTEVRESISTMADADLNQFGASKQYADGMKIIEEICSELEFDYAQVGVWNPKKGPKGTLLGVGNSSKEFAEYYQTHSLHKFDPRASEVASMLRPVKWSFWNGSHNWQYLKTIMVQFNVSHQGLSIPIHAPNGDYIQLGVAKDTDDKQFDFLIRRGLYSLYEFGERLYDVYKDAMEDAGAEDRVLGKREIEVLALSSVGKSASEVAIDLGISVGTVNVHLRTTRVKLGVKKTAEAIYIAKQKGFI